ncbi:MAG TPA: tRNA epoxyqueuosine(34) reductase QueG [Bacteroidota bacterium]|nr:tRNA epoxyqueuosine(34) reductase QueG [Bacteroidota bacterium]
MNSGLTHFIKSKAKEIGFSKVGIVRIEPLEIEGKRLLEWLERGYHADMEWMNRNKEIRINPLANFPTAKSIVCVALDYFTPVEQTDDSNCAKISRYALGEDYHIIVMEKLQTLFDEIKKLAPSCQGKLYVDTGAVMEKVWAARAGLGWIGKNTNLISKDFGSWLFLGEIILDIELECDVPMKNYCGKCRACIEACPTGAFVDEYVLDANRCISYLTIEHRGEIPEELGAKFQQWIFGCDVCQNVCPWNRFARPTQERGFYPRNQLINPKITELLSLSEKDFSSLFKNSPVKRAKFQGFRRNLEAIQNSKSNKT